MDLLRKIVDKDHEPDVPGRRARQRPSDVNANLNPGLGRKRKGPCEARCSPIARLIPQAGMATCHKGANVLEHSRPVIPRGEARICLVDALVRPDCGVVGIAQKGAAESAIFGHDEAVSAARDPVQDAIVCALSERRVGRRKLLEAIRSMNGSLRRRCVGEQPRTKRGAESGGALGLDERGARLAAYHRQRRENGVGQTLKQIRPWNADGLWKEIGAAAQCVRDGVPVARNVRDSKIVLSKKLRPPEKAPGKTT